MVEEEEEEKKRGKRRKTHVLSLNGRWFLGEQFTVDSGDRLKE